MLDELKKFEKQEELQKTDFGLVAPKKVEDEMKEAYLDYAMSVIVSRALPDVRDGLKPVHRRILYAMKELGLTSKAKYRKSATVVGETLGKYHPHGDVAVYDALVRMAQDFAMRYPLVDGQGNFGSIDGDQSAAMRYTEARMTPIAEELLADIEKDTVSFMDNYDGTTKEPTVLPARLPNLLLNGTMGIAVGMATNIPPHNLNEVADAIVALIENPEISTEELLEYIKGPDFPTGGIIYDFKEIKEAYLTGKGRIITRGVAEIVESSKGKKQIVISEIPYGVCKSVLVSKIAELVKLKKIDGIAELRDESDRNGIRVVIELKKDAFAQKILNALYKFTPLQDVFHLNMLALVDGLTPQVMNLKMVLEHWLSHRKIVVEKRCRFDLARAKERAHILEALHKALENLDETIKIIKTSQTREIALKNLMKKFNFDEVQANAILDIRLSTLASLERRKIEEELKEKKNLIVYLEGILADPQKILKIIKDEIKEMKEKYGDPRRTKVVKSPLGALTDSDLIPNEEVIITVTASNYIKRTPVASYRSQARGGKGVIGMEVNEEDRVTHLLASRNLDNLLFFTNLGRVFKSKVYEIPVASRTAKGTALANIIFLKPEEKVKSVIAIGDKEAGYLFMATKGGIVKKTPLSEYKNVTRGGIIAIKLNPKDELCWARLTKGDDQVILVTQNGLSIRFKEKEVRPMNRIAKGVIGIKLEPDDKVVGMDIADNNKDILIVSEMGMGKRTPIKLYKTQNRGGKGIITQKITEKTKKVKAMEVVGREIKDVVLVSKNGQVIRIPFRKIPVLGRATQGVRLIRLGKDDEVASMTCIKSEEIKEEDKEIKKTGEKSPKDNNKKEIRRQTKQPVIPKVKIKSHYHLEGTSENSMNNKEEPLSKPLFVKKQAKKHLPRKSKEIIRGLSSEEPAGDPNYWGFDRTLWRKKK